ncbi:hypothetical protein ACR79R_21405 [Sphingobacterium spiritivorum]
MDQIRKWNALLAFHFNIPFPEKLPNDVYTEKVAQLNWVLKNNKNGHY